MGRTWTGGFAPVPSTRWPVFRRDHPRYALFYAPGRLVVVDASRAEQFESSVNDSATQTNAVATSLVRHAADAEARHRAIWTDPFEPVCLTLYLGNRCNLSCTYCFAAPSGTPSLPLSWPAIRPVAESVLTNCVKRGIPFATVFHGGGEPGLYPDLIATILDGLEQLAVARGLTVFRYLATNGVLPAARTRWLARRFDTVGLSCDGPPLFQTRQRPTSSGKPTSPAVERTAQIIRGERTRLHVRATITPLTMRHQADIVAYLCERLQPDEIALEPVYSGGRAGATTPWHREDAEVFVTGFIEARALASRFGVPLRPSISRPSETHGPYCNVARNVLQLVPGGVASACFKTNATDGGPAPMTAISSDASDNNELALDGARIARIRHLLSRWPARCQDCFNRFHCTLGCPDSCPLDPTTASAADFRCHVAKELTTRSLDDLAAAAWQDPAREDSIITIELSHHER